MPGTAKKKGGAKKAAAKKTATPRVRTRREAVWVGTGKKRELMFRRVPIDQDGKQS